MSLEAIDAPASEPTIVMDVDPPVVVDSSKPLGLNSPPDSNNAMTLDGTDSELSDIDEVADKLDGKLEVKDAIKDEIKLEPAPTNETQQKETEVPPEPTVEEEEDIGEVLPDHWSGTVPVFKPTMKQFQDFKVFMTKVDKYGMKSGIIKIIPPQEWKDSLPPLDDMVKQVRVREPIKQEIMGSNGTYRQVNILHQRSYNLPQWRQLCEQSEHQPPARRGERRANAEKKPSTRSRAAANSGAPKPVAAPAKKRGRGRATRASARTAKSEPTEEEEDRPMTPVSPAPEKEEVVDSVEQDPGIKEEEQCDDDDASPAPRRMGFSRQGKPKMQSVSARRKYVRREGSAMIDEAAFKDWDYRMDVSEFTPERCEELERIYWKTLTYASPLYGADLLGTLFSEDVKLWNLNKLPNLLDVLGTKVPGVNTAYLYLGMWKATFAWHLEDVDLYSINYLHFGAPKQWYSISQADARRFEAAMKNIWPTEAKSCDQFLRHKGFLISPAHLKQHYNITVNKCVSYPGEFVVTYPYGYHSGYNLGYNCAEAVNFALDSWLPMGKIAKRCQCAQAQDSVWVDVYEIERKLRGEETEYEETDEEEDDEDDEDDIEINLGLPSPPHSHGVRVRAPGKKRKRGANEKDRSERRAKKARVRVKPYVEPPCCLCPNDIPGAEIMSTDDGRKAHRMCALYLPETYIEEVDGQEIIANIGGINKDRLELKCLYCRSKKGACFQCSQKKCHRSYHATCAAAAGVFVEESEVPVFGEDGTEYKEQAFEFSCRFHRTKRDRKAQGAVLEDDPRVREVAAALKKNDICQLQYFRGEIFAGVVVENRVDEEMLLLDVIPNGYVSRGARSDGSRLTISSDRVEVEWKWLLLPDPADYRLPKASANAILMPTCRKAKQEINAKRAVDEVPRKNDEFGPGLVWAEFHTSDRIQNRQQVKIDLSKDNQVWHYLGKTSTEAKAQYTENLARPEHNLKSNFLDSIPKPVSAVPLPLLPQQPKRTTYTSATFANRIPFSTSFPHFSHNGTSLGPLAPKQPKPYTYKPKQSIEPLPQPAQFMSHKFALKPAPPVPFSQMPHHHMAHHQPHQQQQHQYIQPHQMHYQQPIQPAPAPMQRHPMPPPPQPQTIFQQQVFQLQPAAPPPQQKPQPPPRLQVKHYQPPLKDSRKKSSSASYSSDRFAPVGGSNGFPQLPGLSWPPAHMKSGQYNQPPRDWPQSATDRPPMTLAMKPSGPGEGQPQIHAYQKYSFFQVHHNRDPVRYQTPYGPGGGFVNGYERNHRAFLIMAQQALNGGKKKAPARTLPPLPQTKSSQPQATPPPPGPGGRQQAGYSSPYAQILPRPDTASSQQSPFTFENLRTGFSPCPASPYQQHQGFSVPTTPASSSTYELKQPGSVPLHPAINPQYSTSLQQQQTPQHGGNDQTNPQSWSTGHQASTPVSNPQPRIMNAAPPSARPAFTKQSHSPIPLPPYVRQMNMQSAPNGQKLSSPLSKPPEQATPQQMMPMPQPQFSPPPSGMTTMQTYSYPEPQSTSGPESGWRPGSDPMVMATTPSPTTQAPPYYQQMSPPQHPQQQLANMEYPPLPTPEGNPSEELVRRMMQNLRRASQQMGSSNL
ncbi:hypothetical protein QBC40DRAFT_292595 [Triangularia verruculosa]|uniref:[histone H3]-trimethyl-L-lysine(9) demethylase n=1 Tax=Triangularia verruculosa TaxID=2587418 RepID=A0AAN6XUD5_9PEZI|nr:hypothetical protein QBC40DRAFT_292595 [Triangularia verruculosa]